MPSTLTKELETYESNKDELLAQSQGKYVLIHGDEVVAAYDSEGDAVAEGYRRFGNVPFLVKLVSKVETPETFVSNLVAL